MIRTILAFLGCFLLTPSGVFAAVNAMMGVTISTSSSILGKTPNSAVMGQTIAGSSGNWWEVTGATVVAAYQPKGAASLAASYVNLANPGTHDAAPGTAPTLDSSGWVFTAASLQYLVTDIVPATGWTIIVRFSNTSGSQCVVAGVNGSSINFFLQPVFLNIGYIYGGGGTDLRGSGDLASGVMCVSDNHPYLNGSSDGADLAPWSGTQTNVVYIGALNNSGGGATAHLNGKIQAVAIYSTTLSAGDVASLTTAINGL